ncbi:MAG: ribose 5-phosphate isomerase B [Helicobacteraceae bacterium]
MKKIFIACDHAGVQFKNFCIGAFQKHGLEVLDLGCFDEARVDYPDYAQKLAAEVLKTPGTQGCLICGTGIGMSIAANRFKGIRAALCHDAYTAAISRAHNDANVLCMGARTTGLATAQSIIDAWLGAEFEGGRHEKRVQKLDNGFNR